ncbi:hypothetical protein [Anoxybacillus flavithermus]|uniref:DUF8042 domain-containing protein n=1 Tax=Anoxybacillus flavithermus AK1 TaxID=1297581 RepID=M8DN69_9BACL|nr:hypothetical protein [Anoxybacillus flavithermus]EMT45880.1 hypothetical protein H919_08113 [Anoxybacillus flavithermus AK1]
MEQKLVVEKIRIILQTIPKVIEKTSQVAEHFQMGQESSGLKEIVYLFDGYDWIVQEIAGLQKVGVSISLDITNWQEIFKEMEKALCSQDYVLLSDLLEYEISPALEAVYKELTTI